MDTIFTTLLCYFLAFPFTVALNSSVPSATTAPDNGTHTSTLPLPTNSTGHVTDVSNSTAFSSTTRDGGTFSPTTAATPESTGLPRTSNSTAPTATTPPPPAANASSTQSTAGPTSTAARTATAEASPTVDRWTGSTGRTTLVLHRTGLNTYEMSMTIAFSSVLGVLGLALVMFMFLKCKHKIQYLHQPLNNTGDPDEFVADDDTLVISGGLYDGHPIYDNLPPVPADQSQFRLQFFQ
ncbi:sialomucin core protein 24-like [Pungitius pungitius]|uniref:sialomucin core protein 24-like n=1 Tax=Pungitius pungitius TaxID=134920 RepID=UPI002E1024BF